MVSLQGDKVYLRALEPEDLDFVFAIENNEEFWEISATSAPYSRYLLKKYIKNSHRDLYEVKQLRLVICKNDHTPVGLIDLFDFEPRDQRAAIGILIQNGNDRGQGYGSESLSLLCDYCFRRLGLHQVYANVGTDNANSQVLFENAGFVQAGHKKDWNYIDGSFKDELLYQLINVH